MPIANFLKKTTFISLGLLISSGVFAPKSIAGRYVLNQTPQTIQRYFGRPIAKVTEQIDNKTYSVYTYSAAGIRRLFPFPKAGQFHIHFIDNRAESILLEANASEKEYFVYSSVEASKFFNYIFGYKPPIWKPIPLPFGGGGHEGFRDHKACLGDGVLTSFISYRLGEEMISLRYDPSCEPPYNK